MVLPRPEGLGEHHLEEVGAHCHRGTDSNEDEERRHKCPAAHAGEANENPYE